MSKVAEIKKGFDLASLEVPDTVEIHIEHPSVGLLYLDDEKQTGPVTISMYGPASEPAIKYRRKLLKEATARLGKRGAKGLIQNQSPEEMERREIERLCALTAGVQNLQYNGELITVETISKIYSDPKMGWLVDQPKEKIGGWDDFLA